MIVEERPNPLNLLREPFDGLPFGKAAALLLAGGAMVGAIAWCIAAVGVCPTGLGGYFVLALAKESVAILILSAWYIAWVRIGGHRRMARTGERMTGFIALLSLASGALYSFLGGPGRHSPPNPYLPPSAQAATANLFQDTLLILSLGLPVALVYLTYDAFRTRREEKELANRKPPLDLSAD